jgi:type II secretory pathway component PulF
MPSYQYRARAAGQSGLVTGSIDALSRRAALQLLQTRGLQVVQLDEEGGSAGRPAAAGGGPRPARITPRHRLPFLEALADLVTAGISAGEALRLLTRRLQEPGLHALCTALWGRVGEGCTLSQAMADHPAVFDRQTVSLIAAGEATGNLHEVLDRLIEHLHEQRELRQKFISALAYPAFICVMSSCLALFLLFYLVPRLLAILTSQGRALPFAAQLLVSGSHLLLYAGPFVLLALIIGGIAFQRWRRTPAGREESDGWLLRLPLVRDFVVRSALFNFTHTLALLIENGITTAEALRLSERTLVNTRLRGLLHAAADRVLEGSSLSSALAGTGLVPPLLLDRLTVGEQTGRLAPGLRDIARVLRKDLSRRLELGVRVSSGLVLTFTFGFVAFLAYAIVSALLQVSSGFRL